MNLHGQGCQIGENPQRLFLEHQPRSDLKRPIKAMKMRAEFIATTLSVVVFAFEGNAQSFLNLNFDSGTTTITRPIVGSPSQGVGYGPVQDLLPGWSLFINQTPSVPGNNGFFQAITVGLDL